MKTNLLLIGMLLVGLFAVSFAIADENTNKCFGSTDELTKCSSNESISEIDATLNENYSGFKYGWIKFGSWFASGDKKTEMELKLAEMKLIQARIVAKNNNTVAMQNALNTHDKLINGIKERVQKESRSNATKDAEKLVGLDRAIEVHQIKIDRLSILLANENLTAEEIATIKAAIERSSNVTAHLENVQEQRKERIKTRLMASENLTEENADQIISEMENKYGISKLNEVRNETSIQKLGYFQGKSDNGKGKN